MKKYTAESLPTEPGLYQSNAQVWELDEDGEWGEIHGDGGEFGDHELVRLTPSDTIDKNTGEYEELVMSDLFGQPEYYRNMRPEFRDAVQSNIDDIIAGLNAAGLTLAVDPDLYGFDHSPNQGVGK